jgi:hypothetical protein
VFSLLSLSPFAAPPAPKIASFYSIQMTLPPILQLAPNKPLHFSYPMQMSAFLAPQIWQLTQNKLLRHKSLLFFYSIQMNGHQSLLTNHYSLLHEAAPRRVSLATGPRRGYAAS